MKFSIDKKILAEALGKVNKVINTRNTVTEYTGVLTEADFDRQKLILTGINSLNRIVIKLDANVEESGSIVMMCANKITNILNHLPVDTAIFEKRGECLFIYGGSAQYMLAALNANTFIVPSGEKYEKSLKIRAICSAIDNVIKVAGNGAKNDGSKVVNLSASQNGAALCAYNSAQIANSEANGRNSETVNLLLSLNDAKTLCEILDDTEEYTVNYDLHSVKFTGGDIEFKTQLIHSGFINCKGILGQLKAVCKCAVNAETLYNALSQIAALCDDSVKSLGLQIEDYTIILSINSSKGACIQHIDAITAGEIPTKKFYYNVNSLLSLIEKISSSVNIGVTACGEMLLTGEGTEYLQIPTKEPTIKAKKEKQTSKPKKTKKTKKIAA